MPTIDAIATTVSDMGESLEFYRLLGFEISERASCEGYVTIKVGAHLRLAWNTESEERSFNPQWRSPTGSGRMGITLRCATPSEVDVTYHLIVNAGYRTGIEPFDTAWGSRHCRLFDPDGNAIDLFAPLP